MSFRISLAGVAAVALLAGCGPKPEERATVRPTGPTPRPAVARARVEPERWTGPWAGVIFTPEYASAACHGRGAWKRTGDKSWEDRPDDNAAKAREREASAITSTQGRARRVADILTVGVARFEDDPSDGDSFAKYTYLGRLEGLPFDVVAGSHWEWSTWTVVDALGRRARLSGPPVASPDGKAFAATADDQMGEDFNGLQIVEDRGGEFVSSQLDAPYACDPVWKGPDEIAIKILPGTVADHEADLDAQPASAWISARAVRDGSGWKLVRPKDG